MKFPVISADTSAKTLKICVFALDKGEKYVIITSVGFGSVPEWPKGADCKSVVFDFGGSNPPAPTKTMSTAYGRCSLFWSKAVVSRNTASLSVFAVRRNAGCLNPQGETIGVRRATINIGVCANPRRTPVVTNPPAPTKKRPDAFASGLFQ